MIGEFMGKIKQYFIYYISLTLVFFVNGCIVDIPSTRPNSSSNIIYGNVLNNETGEPVINAVISDGFSTTLTNKNGKYRLETFPGASYVFISVPEQFEIPMNDGMPQIFEPIDISKDSVQVNFLLTPLENGIEKDFTLLAVADPQVQNTRFLNRLNTETIVDIKKEIENHNTVYGLTLGDLAFDSLALFKDIKQSFINSSIPFFHTIGNHDFSSNVYDPIKAAEGYMSVFGPLDYSFNRGEAHIVVMNNVFNYGVSSYSWGFSKEQIDWLKSNLSHVSKNKMLIISVHIPITPNNSMVRKSEFLDAISSFNEIHILSGHMHANKNYVNSTLNIYEHVTGAASGMWWSSTVNSCGAPNGYGVYEVSGNKMKNWYYKSVNFNRDFQINMLAPYTFGDRDGYVVANVWNADENWKIELLEDGISLGQMEQFTDYAPEVYALNKYRNLNENTNWYQKTKHLYRLKPTKTDAILSIKATDTFGNIYIQNKATESIDVLRKY